MRSKNLRPVSTWCLTLVTSLVLISGFSLSRSGVSVTHAADDPSPSPSSSATPDLEKERLQRAADLAKLKQDKAEADQKTAEAKKGELEAMFPKPSTSPLEGKTTVEGAVIESQMISYVSLAKAANRILTAIYKDVPADGTLAIYNEQDVNLMLSYQVAKSQVNQLIDNGYCGLLTYSATNGICPTPTPTPCPSPGPNADEFAQPAPALAALSIPQSFLGAFVDMTGLLRTNVDIKGQTFTIDEAPLAAEIFRCARGERALFEKVGNLSSIDCNDFKIKGAKFYYPFVFAPDVNSDQPSPILARLETTHNLNGNALQLISAIESDSKQIEDTEAAIKALGNAIDEKLPQAYLDAMTATGIAIRANCPRLSANVQEIMNNPDNQADTMIALVEKALKDCPRMGPDKKALLLGLQKTVGDAAVDLEQAGITLEAAKNKKKNLKNHLEKLLKTKLKLKLTCCATDDELKDAATAAVAQLKGINAQFDNLVAALTQTQAGGLNPLTNYIRTERLSSALKTGEATKSLWLVVKVINAGGNNRIKTNLLVDIFRGGNRLSHSGGVIAEYHLFSSDGTSIRSGTVSDYTNYINAQKVNKITGSAR